MRETSEKARLKAVIEQIAGVEARLEDPKYADLGVIQTELSMYRWFKSALERRLGQ